MSRSMPRLRGLSSGERVSARRMADEAVRRLLTPGIVLTLVIGLVVVALAALAAGRWSAWWVGVVVAALGLVVVAGVIGAAGLRRSPRLARVVAHRLGLRRLPLGSLDRSPWVAAAAERAAAGYRTSAVAELTAIAAERSTSRRERTDAVVALADRAILDGDPDRAVAILGAVDQRTIDVGDTGLIALRCEALALAGRSSEIAAVTTPDRWRRHRDIALLAANGLDPAARIAVIADMLAAAGHRRVGLGAGGTTLTDLVAEPVTGRITEHADERLVTVIVPMYDDASTIAWALGSLLAQSWTALEIIVVDDGGSDGSVAIVEQLATVDRRIRLVHAPVNAGPYGARALALGVATGEFVTVNDADDFAHPDKIARQVAPLLSSAATSPAATSPAGPVATLSSLIRIADDLMIVRRGLVPGDVIGRNYSSLMIRRSVLDALGGWDTVRVGADSELFERLRLAHGAGAVRHVEPGIPLTFARHAPGSLSRRRATGLTSTRHVLGVRRMYAREAAAWHRAGDLVMDRRSATSPFHVPAAGLYRPGETPEAERRFDVVLVSDLALPGGTTASNLEEIAANTAARLRTGLVHHRAHHLNDADPNPKIMATLSDSTRLIALGDEVTAEVVVIKYPPAVLELPDEFPAIATERVIVAVNQTPWTSYPNGGDDDRRQVYDIARVDAELRRVFDVAPTWMPIGPAVRATLYRHHADELDGIDLADDDWVELIDVARWRRTNRPARRADDPIRIGRHGRDTVWKWPADRQQLLAAYPADRRYRVEILGGAAEARRILGRLPSTWRVHEFDTVDPAVFLAGLDVFVNVVHPDMVEAFGRSVLEALAVGVPVVAEPRFADLFGDAIICSAADEVTEHVEALMADPDLYEQQVERGHALVAERFSHEAHRARLAAAGVSRAIR